MTELFTTRSPERSVQEILRKPERRGIVLARYRTIRRVLFRSNMLEPGGVHFYRPWVEGSERVLERWKADGDVLFNQSETNATAGPHDWHLHAECPMSLEELYGDIRETGTAAVVYLPPSWHEHERAIDKDHPTPEVARRVHLALVDLAKRQHSDRARRAAEFAGVPLSGVAIIDDKELADIAMVDDDKLPDLRRVMLGDVTDSKVQCVYSAIPRIEPEDPTVRQLWDWIRALPDRGGGERMFSRKQISKVLQHWRQGLRQLHRSGAIEKKPYLYIYAMTGLAPNFDRIAAENASAKIALTRVREALVAARPIEGLGA